MKSSHSPFVLSAIVFIPFITVYLSSCRVSSKTGRDQAAQCPPMTAETQDRVRIIFYNTENCFDTVDDSTTADEDFLPDGSLHWTYSRYKTKLEKIGKVIVAAGEWEPPDIIGLAEIENSRVLEDLIGRTALLKYEYRYVHKNSPDIRGIDLALLYNPATIRIIETAICQDGTPKGIRATITIGEVRGIIEHQKERELSGFCIVPMATISARIIGIVTGSINCWVSVSLSTADPIAAKIDAYRRYPVIK